MKLELTDIYIYPVKSLAGIRLTESKVELRGLQYDRRWMITDLSGQFITQREIPALAQIGTLIEPPYSVLFDRNAPNDRYAIPLLSSDYTDSEIDVTVWDDDVVATLVGDEADEWLSEKLDQPVHLVAMPTDAQRIADPRFAPEGQYVSFADGFPFLLIGTASLDDLNSRLAQPVPMNRFRPNLVFSGAAAYEEDSFGHFKIGEQHFQGVKPCGRCMITTIDQKTAAKGAEPLKTLSTYRMEGKKILFGQNVIWTGSEEGVIRVGEEIVLL